MDYIGEHRLPGQLGHFFIVLSLVASLTATFSYFKATQSKTDIDSGYWKKLARYAFIAEAFSVFAVFGILFYIIQQHLFEYKYAWQHSSRSLEVKYLLSCFWEGQEGSFLLWSVWHCVLGLILIKTSKQWEAPVMTVVSFAQFCLATMIAGLYIFNYKIGSNPFILLRESGVFDNANGMHIDFDLAKPIRPDYMTLPQMKDGNDLNPLLQNYWMVIHPPVLFMGFASTIVPFAFAVAGLWTKKFGDWIRPALPWALFSAAIFGVGIMMGAAWAYESLTFGGYWAWDPVENASLVPWLVLIAGIHTLLIYKHSGHSLRSTFLFLILAFFFVLYSTFLTRSGILGDASVHAFTDLGMNAQLLIYLLIFAIPSLGLLFYHYKKIPSIQKEESTSSREFWMFIGSLVFFLTAMVIIGKTSLPVVNKILGTKFAAPEDPEYAYNQIQIFVAIILGVLTAVTQYLRYKSTPWKFFSKQIWIPTLLSAIIATLVLAFGDINYNRQTFGFLIAIWIAVVASIYAAIANLLYIWIGVKGKLKLSGGSISHFGFGLVLLGILLSSAKKEILSYNRSGIAIPFGPDSKEKTGENLTLIKGLPGKMGKFDVTYVSDSAHPQKQQWYYKIQDDEEFTLQPNAFVNYKGNEGLMSNPDSRHYWDHDVFTYISSLANPDKTADTASFQTKSLKPGDSLFYSQGFLILEDVLKADSLPAEIFGTDGQLFETPLKIYSKTGSIYTTTPKLAYAKGSTVAIPDTIASERLILQLQKVNPDQSIELGFKESDSVMEYITLKAYKFPFINVLWLGIIITAIGILMSMVRRIRLNRE
jgi:cytochrome c-type biogenesis protein CcmF